MAFILLSRDRPTSKWMDDTEEMDGRAEGGHRAGEVERVNGSGGSASYDRFSGDGLQPEVTGCSLSGVLP